MLNWMNFVWGQNAFLIMSLDGYEGQIRLEVNKIVYGCWFQDYYNAKSE